MKKKLMFLLVGVLGFGMFGHSQLQLAGVNILANGNPIAANSVLALNTVITYQGQAFAIIPIPDVTNNGPALELLEGLLSGVFVLNGMQVSTPNGIFNFGFNDFPGPNIEYTLNAVPFDLGISAVLGAGAIAAVKARRRRKEQEAATA